MQMFRPPPPTAMNYESLGEQELELLRWVSDHAPASVRDVAEGFGAPRNLAKTTVQTVMERLRAKGYLARVKRDGMYEYAPSVPKPALLQRLIHDFVERVLGGSSLPLVAYLAQRRGLTQSELDLLTRLVADEENAANNTAKEQP